MSRFSEQLEAEIRNSYKADINKATESLVVSVIHKGKLKGRVQFGKKYQFYDLASLTKIMFTVPALMKLVQKRKIKTSDPVVKYLDWFPSRQTKLKDLLNHKGGLPWWMPLYKTLRRSGGWQARRYQIKNVLKKMKISKSKKPVYSDVDFWSLGFVLEQVYKKNLLEIFKFMQKSYGPNQLHFVVNNKTGKNKKLYAPTEKCPWRKKILRGEVHDDNTWAFGGVSTHAGLFGRIEDVETYGKWLRREYKKNPRSSFFKRQKGDWTLGFMMPSKTGSSAGKLFSKSSIGHTGFTGTSFWFDPKQDLIVIVLSNRVYPKRSNINIRKLRPIIHDSAVKILRSS